MANALFTHSYFLHMDPKQLRTRMPYPPLATMYAMALARESGHRVHFVDSMFETHPGFLAAALAERAPEALVIYDDTFNYLTKMCLSNMQRAAFEMIRLGREAGCLVVVWSSDASDHRDEYLAAGADLLALGEAELTVREILDAVDAGTDPRQVPGVCYLDGGSARTSPPRENLRDLSILPDPAWDLVDLAPYRETWMRAHGSWSLNLVSTRGCPYKCTWCAKPIYGQQYACHAPDRFVGYLEHLVNRYGVRRFWFADDIFGLREDWVEQFADLVEARGLDIRFMIQTRVDLMMRDSLREGLIRAGLETAWLGAESGSQKVLDAMKKGIRVEDTYRVVPLLRSRGVRVCLFLQFGYLGEEKADIERTIQMVRDLVPDEIGISVSYPLPGTEFHEQVKGELQAKTNWTDSDDLAMLYQGRFSSTYYRRLHRHVHRILQLERGKQSLRALLRRPWTADRGSLRRAATAVVYAPWTALESALLRRLENAS